jgi:tetratricopeptide (TPR) repeat protein
VIPPASSGYRRNVQQADAVLAHNGAEVRADNWQELAMEWFAPKEPERSALAAYIATHEDRLGVAWAQEVLRMEVFFQAGDHLQIVEHFERAFARYPRCAVMELWVADMVFRHGGDFWRARRMYRYALETLPDHPKPYYELGFMSYLLGDFPGALDQFNRAAERLREDDNEMAARVFYNRGLVRYFLDGDKQAAIADVQEALRRKPDYPQAKDALRGLRGKARWVPW